MPYKKINDGADDEVSICGGVLETRIFNGDGRQRRRVVNETERQRRRCINVDERRGSVGGDEALVAEAVNSISDGDVTVLLLLLAFGDSIR